MSCLIGELTGEICANVTELENTTEQSKGDIRELILWRGELNEIFNNQENYHVCCDHLNKYFTRYALRQRYCCNPTKKEKHEHVKKGMLLL